MLTGSIVRRHNHANVIRFIGLSFDGTAFPAVLKCPFCGENTLYAFDYTAREDIWFNCTACSGHGTIITLAAQIWNIDPHSAIKRLIDSGLTNGGGDEDIVDIVKLHEKQKTAEKFWQTASGQLWTHADDAVFHRHRELGISKEIPCDGLIGVVNGVQFSDFAAAIHRAVPKAFHQTRLATVFPYYDLPGHFSGFLFIQTTRRMETAQFFFALTSSVPGRADAGYFMINNALLPPHDVLKDSLFLVNDPAWVLQAQTVQMRHDAPLLPICATYAGPEAVSHGTSLHNFKHTKKLFSGASVTSEIISQAANGRGYVCVPPPEGALTKASPLKTMRRLKAVYRSAKTWQAALLDELKNNEPTAAVSFASKLNIARNKLQDFLRAKTDLDEISIIEILSRIRPHYAMTESGGGNHAGEVIERDDGWYTPAGSCITTCAPRITRIVYTPSGEKYYEGYVKQKNVVVEFFSSAAVIEKAGLLLYAEQLLAAKNVLVISTPRWNKKALNIALMLHTPEILNISDKLGWDEQTKEFRFSSYSIGQSGEIIPPKCPQLQAGKTFDFPEPATSAPLEITDFLTPSYENAFVWAIFAAVAANFLAPVMGVPQVGVAVSKAAYETTLAIGRALCCGVYPADNYHVINKANDNSLMILSTSKLESRLKYITLKWLNQPVFIEMSPANILTALSYRWVGVVAEMPAVKSANYDILKHIVPIYVQRILRSRVGLAGAGYELIQSILQDAHKWLNESYGCTFNIDAAAEYFYSPDNAHVLFMRELNKAISEGHLDVLPRHRLSRQKQNYIMRSGDHWWINRMSVNEYLIKTGISPDWQALINCFSNDGVFCGQETVNGVRWFLLSKNWCDEFWSDYKEKNAG